MKKDNVSLITGSLSPEYAVWQSERIDRMVENTRKALGDVEEHTVLLATAEAPSADAIRKATDNEDLTDKAARALWVDGMKRQTLEVNRARERALARLATVPTLKAIVAGNVSDSPAAVRVRAVVRETLKRGGILPIHAVVTETLTVVARSNAEDSAATLAGFVLARLDNDGPAKIAAVVKST